MYANLIPLGCLGNRTLKRIEPNGRKQNSDTDSIAYLPNEGRAATRSGGGLRYTCNCNCLCDSIIFYLLDLIFYR